MRGIVTYDQPGLGVYIQDRGNGVFARSTQSTPIALGTELDVVGFPVVAGYSPVLDDAIFRTIGVKPPVEPVKMPATDIVKLDPDGLRIAPLDSDLVQLTGRLIEVSQGSGTFA